MPTTEELLAAAFAGSQPPASPAAPPDDLLDIPGGQVPTTKNQDDKPGDPRQRLDDFEQGAVNDAAIAWFDADAAASKAEAAKTEATEALLAYLRPGERWQVDGTSLALTVKRPSRKFDLARAQYLLGPDVGMAQKTALDATLAKAVLKSRGISEDQYMKAGTGDGVITPTDGRG